MWLWTLRTIPPTETEKEREERARRKKVNMRKKHTPPQFTILTSNFTPSSYSSFSKAVKSK
jgi:hypothetical protein